jgi:hypothetical protein
MAAPRKRQQPIGQLRAEIGCFLRFAQHRSESVVLDSHLYEFDVACYNRQEVVEVVGNPAGELANCFEPLRLCKLVLALNQSFLNPFSVG